MDALLEKMHGKSREEALRILTEEMAKEDGRPVPAPGDCQTCGAKPPHEFRDRESRQEFGQSGMCQPCQDSVFAEED